MGDAKKVYLDKIESQLKDWKSKIEVIKNKGVKLAANAGADMKDWPKKEEEIKAKLKELAASGSDRFETLKSSTETAVSELKSVVEQWLDKNK